MMTRDTELSWDLTGAPRPMLGKRGLQVFARPDTGIVPENRDCPEISGRSTPTTNVDAPAHFACGANKTPVVVRGIVRGAA